MCLCAILLRGFTGTGLEAAATGSGTGASTSLSMMMSSSSLSLMGGMLRLRSPISRLELDPELGRWITCGQGSLKSAERFTCSSLQGKSLSDAYFLNQMINVVVLLLLFLYSYIHFGQHIKLTASRRVWARLQLTRPRNVMLITSHRKYALASIYFM